MAVATDSEKAGRRNSSTGSMGTGRRRCRRTNSQPATIATDSDSGTSSQGLCVNAICQLNEVAPGTPITMVVTGTVGSDVTGLVTNKAQGFSATEDDNPANNRDTAPTTINALTALQIAKRDLTDPVYAGGSYFYEIVITNTGPSDAANTVVTDTLPTALTVLGVSPECTFSNSGSPSTVSCAVGSFPAGTSRDLSLIPI